MSVVRGPASWVRRFARETPDRLAIASPTTRLSYAALDVQIDVVAGALLAAGVGAGDHVASSLPLSPAAAVIGLAAQRIGAVSVEIPRDLSGASRRRALALTRPRAAFGVDADELALAVDAALVVVVGDDFVVDDVAIGGAFGADAEVDVDADALVLFTSGSTGDAVGVRLSLRNLAANAASIVAALGIDQSDHGSCTLPLSYAYGRSILHSHLAVGASVFLDARFAFPWVVLEALRREGCTSFSGVPVTYEVLRRQGLLSQLKCDTLRRVTQAGGRLDPATSAAVRAALAPVPFVVMYGATEATARLTVLDADDAVRKPGSIGKPIEGVSLALVDGDGRAVAPGVVGALVARGDNIARGYLGDDALSAAVFRDGALHTGDIGRVDDDGFFFLEGRASQMMKIAGHRTSPSEIEDELLAHADIVEAAVVGVPDALIGEAPVAFIVVRDGAVVDDHALRVHLARRLAPAKVPKTYVRLSRLPRSQNGKLQRRDLRGLLASPEQRAP